MQWGNDCPYGDTEGSCHIDRFWPPVVGVVAWPDMVVVMMVCMTFYPTFQVAGIRGHLRAVFVGILEVGGLV